jgi:hypothetical protein
MEHWTIRHHVFDSECFLEKIWKLKHRSHAKIYFNFMGDEPMTISRLCKTRGLGEEEKQEHMKN